MCDTFVPQATTGAQGEKLPFFTDSPPQSLVGESLFLLQRMKCVERNPSDAEGFCWSLAELALGPWGQILTPEKQLCLELM